MLLWWLHYRAQNILLYVDTRQDAEMLQEKDLKVVPADGLEEHSRLSPGKDQYRVVHEIIL